MDRPTARRRAQRRAATLLLALGVLALPVAPPAHAAHQTPPSRTFTYDVQQRGAVVTDLEGFARHAAATLRDVRGWSLGGSLAFQRVPAGGDFTLWLAEASTMTSFSSACSPTYSCRVGRHVVVNDTRWRTATPSWTRSLDEYQHYVVVHELGHWLQQGHVGCPGPGRPAPVMQQQSKSLGGCTANVWPLPGERAAVAQRYGVGVRPDAFTDIADSVHADAVRELADAGIAAGYPDGSYRPLVGVTRGQLATLLARSRGLQPTGATTFPDIAGSPHARGILAVADAGIATGYQDGTFGPDDPALRGQTAAFLARMLGLDTRDASCAPADTRASVHAGAVCALLRAGVAQGRADGSFGPFDVVDRGQAASLLARARRTAG